jgi:beta propeller repeat protein
MRKAFLLGIILSVVAGPLSAGVVRRVPQEYEWIQDAILDCNDGDIVLVSPGVYYETINFAGLNITVTSTDPNDPAIVAYTIINADGDGTVVTFENGETNRAVLTGFTITGGFGTLSEWSSPTYKEFYGAGIYCSYNASPTITRNVITRNHAPYYQRQDGGTYEYAYSVGGGICCMGARAVITHNKIYNNSAYQGGGIYASGYTTVANNLIYSNSGGYGGGVAISQGHLINNTIVNNDVGLVPEWGRGGNVYAYFSYGSSLGTVANNIISGAKSGGGLYHSQAHGDMIRFNNVWGNTPANYLMPDPKTNVMVQGGKADWTGRFGNISEDPLFQNPAMNDFHLRPESPCINAGDPNPIPGQGDKDIDGDPRVFAVRVDIGADEHVGYVKPLAHAGADQHVLVPEPITLDGTGSYFSDPDGTKIYQWRQIEGGAVELSDAAGAQPVFTPPAEGWYRFELIVDDGQYASKPDEVLVVVGNAAPVAHAGPDRLWRFPGQIMLDGSRSYDPDPPDKLTYTWTQLEGPPVNLITADFYGPRPERPYFVCQEPGIYVFELMVGDGFTTSEPDTVRIEAAPFTIKATSQTFPPLVQSYPYNPSLGGAKLVYTSESYTDGWWRIQCLDIPTGRIDTFQSQRTNVKPRMDGDTIVWAAGPEYYYRPMSTGIATVNLGEGKVRSLRTGTSTESYGYPAISGKKVVWLRHRGVNTGDLAQYAQTPYDICGADISDPDRPVYFTIAERVGRGMPYPSERYYENYDRPVDICGDLVVWEADGDIYGADLSDLSDIQVFPICTAPEMQYGPSISGRRVVWTDERNDVGDIYGADLSDLNDIREFEVYVGPGRQTQPHIDGTMVVFVEGGNRGNIRVYCMSREYGPVEVPQVELGWLYGGGPQIDGSMLTRHYSNRLEVVKLEFGYNLTDGPIQNLATGKLYDYIQHAIDTAGDNDVILVPPGRHEEKLRLHGKSLIVRSTDPEDPAVRAATVLAGPGQRVTFMDEETTDCILTGFTIAGGSYGIFTSGSTPTISHCTIVDNSHAGAKVWGGSHPTFIRSEILGNGMGVEMWTPTDRRPVLTNFGTFRNCLIAGNRGIGVLEGNPTLENCTIADNLGIGVNTAITEITNSIIYFNGLDIENLRLRNARAAVTYSAVQGGWEGEGNIDADPLFAARGHWVDADGSATDPGAHARWVPGDYHLKSQGWSWSAQQGLWTWDEATSPCIDAGDPATPLGDEPAVVAGDPLSERAGPNTRVNMGAYGGTAEASLAPR